MGYRVESRSFSEDPLIEVCPLETELWLHGEMACRAVCCASGRLFGLFHDWALQEDPFGSEVYRFSKEFSLVAKRDLLGRLETIETFEMVCLLLYEIFSVLTWVEWSLADGLILLVDTFGFHLVDSLVLFWDWLSIAQCLLSLGRILIPDPDLLHVGFGRLFLGTLFNH